MTSASPSTRQLRDPAARADGHAFPRFADDTKHRVNRTLIRDFLRSQGVKRGPGYGERLVRANAQARAALAVARRGGIFREAA